MQFRASYRKGLQEYLTPGRSVTWEAATTREAVLTEVNKDADDAPPSPAGDPPIRVALILYKDDLNIGGSLRVVEILAHAFDEARVEAHIVFAYGEPGPIASKSKVPCHFLRATGPLDIQGWMRARSVMGEIKPHILHFHNPVYWLHAALAGRDYKKIFHLHGPYFLEKMGRFQHWLLGQTRRLVDAGVSITRETRQTALDHGWSPARTWTVFNAIDCRSVKSEMSKADARALLGLPEDCLVAGVVCRLAWYKGCQDAIRIVRRLDPRWHLVFCGDGPMRPYLDRLAKEEGIGHRTHFLGMQDDVAPVYAAMDAFLFLSKLEPFGLVIAEAMAAGVPVFGLGGVGAYRDPLYPLVTPSNAVFVERTSPADYLSPEPSAILDQIASRISEFGAHPERFSSMISRAEEWVFERFDAHVQAASMTEAYRLVMAPPPDLNGR